MTDLAGFQLQEVVDVQVMSGCGANAQEKMFPVFLESLSYEELAKELSEFFNKPVSKNTLKNNWFNTGGRIDRIYQGLELPSPLKTDSGRITPFGIAAVFEFTALVHFDSKPYDDYVLSIRNRYKSQCAGGGRSPNPDDLDRPEPATPPASRLGLPSIQPVASAIVPSNTFLPTDSQELTALAETGKEAIEQTSQDLEQIRSFLTQVNAFVGGKIDQLDSETEVAHQQVQELRNLAFQLEVKQETLRRAEIRNAAARQESEAARVAATDKVVNLSDFFAKKSSPQPSPQ